MPIDQVLQAMALAQAAGRFTGYIQDCVQQKLIALANSEFDAGLRALRAAENSETERTTLLQEARACFHKAISLEKGHRLAATLLGLAVCHAGLGDRFNANVALLELMKLDPNDFLGFFSRILRRPVDPELQAMKVAVREYLFQEYRYAVPVGEGVYDFSLVRDL